MVNAGDWFGGLSLASKYGIVLGTLIFLTLTAGFIKLCIMRRRLSKHIKQQKDEAAGKAAEDEYELNKRELDEGDLFGVRAIESGFYGGVAQSRPASAMPSNASRTTLQGESSRPSTLLPETPASAAAPGRQIEKLAPEGHDYQPHAGPPSSHGSVRKYDMQLNQSRLSHNSQLSAPPLGPPPQLGPPSPGLSYEQNPDILFQTPIRGSPRILLPRTSHKDLTANSGRPSPLDLGTPRASYFSDITLADEEGGPKSLPMTPHHRSHIRTPTNQGYGNPDLDAVSSPRHTTFPHESPRTRPSDST